MQRVVRFYSDDVYAEKASHPLPCGAGLAHGRFIFARPDGSYAVITGPNEDDEDAPFAVGTVGGP